MVAAIHERNPVTFLPRDADFIAPLGRRAIEILHNSVSTMTTVAVKVASFSTIIFNGLVLADMVVSLEKVYPYSSFATIPLYFCVSYEVNAIFFAVIDAL